MIYTIKNNEIDIKRVFKISKAKARKPATYKCICEEGSMVSGDIEETLLDASIYNEEKVLISGVNTYSGKREYYFVNNKNGSLKFKQYENNIYKKPTDEEMLNHIISPGKTRFLISSFVKNNWVISTLLILIIAILGFVYYKTSGNNTTNFTYIVAELALPLIAMAFTYIFWLQKKYQESMFAALATSGLTLFAAIVNFNFTNIEVVMSSFKSDMYLVFGFFALAIIIILLNVLPVKQWYLYLGIPVFYIAIAMLTINIMLIGKFGTAYSLYVLEKIAFTISLFLLVSVFEKWHNERVFCDCIIKAENEDDKDNSYESKLYKDDFTIGEENEYKSLFTRLFESLGNKDCIRYYTSFKLTGKLNKVDLEICALVNPKPEQEHEYDVIYKLPQPREKLEETLSNTKLFEESPDSILVCSDKCDEIYYIKGRVKNNKIRFYRCEVENDSTLVELVSEIEKEYDELASNNSSEDHES